MSFWDVPEAGAILVAGFLVLWRVKTVLVQIWHNYQTSKLDFFLIGMVIMVGGWTLGIGVPPKNHPVSQAVRGLFSLWFS